MKLTAILLFIVMSTPVLSQCLIKSGYKRCDYSVHSEALGNSDIPVFLYESEGLDPEKEVHFVLFLHGRGYSREVGAKDSMLDHLGLVDTFKITGDQVIFVAPQDRFFHDDSQSVGQDYWIGKEGRSWSGFLTGELHDFVSNLSQKRGVNSFQFNSAVGISMGAHGALMLGHNHPDFYQHIGVLSPIFRPVVQEMPESDYDVFLHPNGEVIEEVNMGNLSLQNKLNLKTQTVITISETDFGLDSDKFPMALKAWDHLLKSKNDLLDVSISPHQGGHSMSFWREELGKVLVKSHRY
ncbi:MAG: alpha/beta hydrolase-fold protein [Bdellovibrionota bacterium]|nr:alpha/beta hydrolase-fold protein [Bdellovibrionota bacterium]